jgi:hypothetical protein
MQVSLQAQTKRWYAVAGRIGLSAKGVVYCLSGLIALFAALHFQGKTAKDAGQKGIFNFVQDQPLGSPILLLIAAGLICFTFWRMVQAFADTEHKGSDKKGLAKRSAYLYSGLLYAAVAWYAIKLVLKQSDSGDGQQGYVSRLLSLPYGQWIVGAVAVGLFITGVYQLGRAFSGKYKKYVRSALHNDAAQWISTVGVAGYSARGIVWLILGWLFLKSAFNANAGYVGGTDKAFAWLQNGWYGSLLLGIVALGLICYGIFMLLRARYQHFST